MADRYRVFIDLPPSDLSDLDPRFEGPRWEEEDFYRHDDELYGHCPVCGTLALRCGCVLSRASGVCPSFGRGFEAAPLAGASLARETKEAA